MLADSHTALKRRRTKLALILSGLVFATMQGCGLVTVYGKQEGVVLDEETKTPIEGAGVVATYSYTYPTVGGSHSIETSARETVTGPDGRFKIPATLVSGSCCLISWFEPYPTFYVIKPGFGGDWFPTGDEIKNLSEGYDKKIYQIYKDKDGYVIFIKNNNNIPASPSSTVDRSFFPNYEKMKDDYREIKYHGGK